MIDLGTGIAVLAAVAISIPAPAAAGTQAGQFAVEDAGRLNCSAYSKARAANGPDQQRMVGFIEGYLTAANRYEPDTFDLTPWHNHFALALILDQHCKKNPSDTLVNATQKLVLTMKPQRLSNFSKLLEIKDGKERTIIYQSVLERAQAELTRKKLYKGAADGRYSPELKVALQTFQRTAKLPPSGMPDPATLWALLNP
jgi:hypothetical protein